MRAIFPLLLKLVSFFIGEFKKWQARKEYARRQTLRDKAAQDPGTAFSDHFSGRVQLDSTDLPGEDPADKADTSSTPPA